MADTLLRPIPKINGFSLQRPRLLPSFVFVALLLLISLFIVWSRLQVVNLDYDIASLETQLRSLQHESQELRLESASLSRPARIEQLARARTADSSLYLTPRSDDAGAGNPFRVGVRSSGATLDDLVLAGAGPMLLDQQVYLALSYDPTLNVVRLYTNGVLVASGPAVVPLSTLDDRSVWLGRSQIIG
jgi:cell division protein FtsL